MVSLLKPHYEASLSFGPECSNKKCKAHLDVSTYWRASMTAVAVERAADKNHWEVALKKANTDWESILAKANIEWEAVIGKVQLEAEKLSTTATAAIDSLGTALQKARRGRTDSKHQVEVVQEEPSVSKSDGRNPANLAVRNSGLESELFELKKLHRGLELEMGVLKKRATVADNLKLKNARLKNRLSQPELPLEIKAAVARSHKVDGLETQLSQANTTVTVLERELEVTRKARDGLTAVLGQKEIMLETQEKVLAAIRLEAGELRTNLTSREDQLTVAAATITRLEDMAPYVNQSFVIEAVRALRKTKADNASTLDRVERLKAGSRGDVWGLVEATQNVICQALDHTTENIRQVLKIGSRAVVLPLGGVLDPEDFPGFTEVRRRSK